MFSHCYVCQSSICSSCMDAEDKQFWSPSCLHGVIQTPVRAFCIEGYGRHQCKNTWNNLPQSNRSIELKNYFNLSLQNTKNLLWSQASVADDTHSLTSLNHCSLSPLHVCHNTGYRILKQYLRILYFYYPKGKNELLMPQISFQSSSLTFF